jgi:hypothetical protein
MWRPWGCPEPGGGSRSHGDTWRPWSYPEPGGGSQSHGDTWRTRSCPEPEGGSQSRWDTWCPRSCPEPGGGRRSHEDKWCPWCCPAPRGGCWSPGAALSWEAGTTPPPPLSRPSVGGQGMVVPITPPDNPHQMIKQGKTGFRVMPDRLVLTVVTSSPTPSLIPSFARAALADPHWRAAMEEEYRALISSGT